MKWFELFGTFLVECGQQLLPTINALAYLAAGAFIYHMGISAAVAAKELHRR